MSPRSIPVDAAAGSLIVVVGPSGAGKDTILDLARTHFVGRADVMFVRRVVTRGADATTEDHDCMAPDEFEAARDAGAFAFDWRAHGLAYGLPADLDRHLSTGGVAVANGSRASLPRLAERYPDLLVVHVRVSRDILAGRLMARGRETPEEIAARLERAGQLRIEAGTVVEIGNDGPPRLAADALVSLIESRLSC
jgi:ribose 1,5-bisphosphokinase